MMRVVYDVAEEEGLEPMYALELVGSGLGVCELEPPSASGDSVQQNHPTVGRTPGGAIVDLGAAPGGWSQVAAERVRAVQGHGAVVAIDMHGIDPIPGVTILHQDFYDADAPDALRQALGGKGADAVVSDMAAHATGHRQTDHFQVMGLAEAALEFAREVLNPGGTFIAKMQRGGTEAQLLAELKRDFATVRHVKPKSSRDVSSVLYLVATGFRGVRSEGG